MDDGREKGMKMTTLCLAGNLLKHPANIVNNQNEVGAIRVLVEGVGPPTKTQYHQEHAIRTTVVEIVEREVVRKIIVNRGPSFSRRGLDRQPPFKYSRTERPGIDPTPARIVPGPFHELGDLHGSVASRKRKAR